MRLLKDVSEISFSLERELSKTFEEASPFKMTLFKWAYSPKICRYVGTSSNMIYIRLNKIIASDPGFAGIGHDVHLR